MSDLARQDSSNLSRERCPTCNAPRRGEAVCYRCKSDLGPLIRLEDRIDQLRLRARRCYARGWYRQTAVLADQMVRLERSGENLRLLACARLMAGDFPVAAEVFRQAHQSQDA